MNPKRIITNGEFFRIQEFRDTGILWWKKKNWVTQESFVPGLHGIGSMPDNYKSYAEAQEEIDRQSKLHDWEVTKI